MRIMFPVSCTRLAYQLIGHCFQTACVQEFDSYVSGLLQFELNLYYMLPFVPLDASVTPRHTHTA